MTSVCVWRVGGVEEELEKERGREERQGGKAERLDKMNYAKLSEAAIVGGAGCVKASQS